MPRRALPLVLLAACAPKVTQDPQCNAREQEVIAKLRSPGAPAIQVTGEWGPRKGGFTWVMNQRGARVKIDVGHLEPDDAGRSRYQVVGTMEGVVEGSTLYYRERSASPSDGSFGIMTVRGSVMSGPRWAKGGGPCFLNPTFEQIRLQ